MNRERDNTIIDSLVSAKAKLGELGSSLYLCISYIKVAWQRSLSVIPNGITSAMMGK